MVEKLPEYKESGFESIDIQERALLKWAGVNVQKPRDAGYFLMRGKIPSGVINSEQARVLANISKAIHDLVIFFPYNRTVEKVKRRITTHGGSL